MKKTILALSILVTLSFIFSSCSKDDPKPTTIEGAYKVVIEGKTFEGKSGEIGYLNNAASIGGEDFSVLITSVPFSETKDIDGADCTVTILGNNILQKDGSEETYISISGTITRASSTKISFQTVGKKVQDWTSEKTYVMQGTIESDAYKNIQ